MAPPGCVCASMNKFRKAGVYRNNGGLEVHNSLLSVVLHETPRVVLPHCPSKSAGTRSAPTCVSIAINAEQGGDFSSLQPENTKQRSACIPSYDSSGADRCVLIWDDFLACRLPRGRAFQQVKSENNGGAISRLEGLRRSATTRIGFATASAATNTNEILKPTSTRKPFGELTSPSTVGVGT